MPTMQDVREKFPQYNDMSDQVLADSLHEKFYSDLPKDEYYKSIGFKTTPTPGAQKLADATGGGVADILRKRGGEAYRSLTRPFEDPVTTSIKALGGTAIAAGGTINDLIGLAGKKVMDTGIAKELAEPFIQSGKTLLSPTAEKVSEILKNHPQAAKDIQGLTDASGLILAPSVARGAKALIPAGKEALNIAADVGGTVANKARNVMGKMVPEDTPANLIQSGAKWSTKLSPEEAKKLSGTLLKEKLSLNPRGYDKLENTVDSINDSISKAIKPHANEPLDIGKVLDRTKEAREKASHTATPSEEIAKVDDVVETFKKDWGDGKLTIGEGQNVKKDIYRRIKKHYQSVAAGGTGAYTDGEIAAWKNIARGLKEEIETGVPDAEVKALNARESELLNLEPHLRRAVGRIGNHNILSLDDVLATTAGTVLGGPVVGAAAGIAKRALGSPAMKSKLAMALDTLANPSASPELKSKAMQTAKEMMDATNPKARLDRTVAPSIDAPLPNPPVLSTAMRMPENVSAINALNAVAMKGGSSPVIDAARQAEVDKILGNNSFPPAMRKEGPKGSAEMAPEKNAGKPVDELDRLCRQVKAEDDARNSVKKSPSKGPEGVIGRINEMGGMNVYDDYNAPEMRQFSDMKRVMKKAGLKPDEIAANLNDEGYLTGTGEPWTGDSLIETLKSGKGRNVLTPGREDAIFSAKARGPEHDWIERQPDYIAWKEENAGQSHKDFGPSILDWFGSQGISSPEITQENIDAFLDSLDAGNLPSTKIKNTKKGRLIEGGPQ